jgi:hypothetical protein
MQSVKGPLEKDTVYATTTRRKRGRSIDEYKIGGGRLENWSLEDWDIFLDDSSWVTKEFQRYDEILGIGLEDSRNVEL